MNSEILIPTGEKNSYWCYKMKLSNNEWYKMHVENVCVINIQKRHNHCYYIEYFFYDTKKIGFQTYKLKKELLSAIQKLLKENIKS